MFKIQNPVLVVIDMQKGFLNHHSDYIIENVVALIHECHGREIPVVFTRFFNTAGSPFETLMNWKALCDEPETDLIDELVSLAKAVIDKNFFTSFTNKFTRLVQDEKWKTIILCGIATESCVLKTAADVFERRLLPIVVSDACSSDMGDEFHLAGLLALQSLIGPDQIMTTSELLDRL